MVILAGAAASGKTRCLYEALYAEVPDWRMLRAETGAQINALVRDQMDLARTVLWLDELEKFFASDGLTANSVRRLIAGRRPSGPVLLAGTIRDLQMLLNQSEPEDRPGAAGQHAHEVKRMLAHRYSPSEPALFFHVDSRFSHEEIARAETVADRDPRLRTALRDAENRRVTATLAGAPELIDYWILDTGDSHGQAIITAAVTARRCGHPEPVPVTLLESLALAQLAAAGGKHSGPWAWCCGG